MEFGNYSNEQRKEEEEFNKAIEITNAATNKKPVVEYVEVSSIASTSAGIKAKATDADGENLTYILYLGTSEDNLEEKDKKENIEQGTEVEFTITGIDTSVLCYYRIDVLDRYETVKSEIGVLQNKAPKITAEITKDITVDEKDPTKSISWIQISANVEDEDDDKLDVKIYLGTAEAEKLGEADLIESKKDVSSRSNNSKKTE